MAKKSAGGSHVDTTAVARLRGETLFAEKTIIRWALGKRVSPGIARTLRMASQKMGLIIGPQPEVRT